MTIADGEISVTQIGRDRSAETVQTQAEVRYAGSRLPSTAK